MRKNRNRVNGSIIFKKKPRLRNYRGNKRSVDHYYQWRTSISIRNIRSFVRRRGKNEVGSIALCPGGKYDVKENDTIRKIYVSGEWDGEENAQKMLFKVLAFAISTNIGRCLTYHGNKRLRAFKTYTICNLTKGISFEIHSFEPHYLLSSAGAVKTVSWQNRRVPGRKNWEMANKCWR